MPMDCTIIRTRAHKEEERTFCHENRPAWGCFFVEDATADCMGIRLTWLDGPYACSPDEHFTDNGGCTFKRVSSSLLPPDWTMDKQIGEIETDPDKLSTLEKLMVAYQESLGGPVFSV